MATTHVGTATYADCVSSLRSSLNFLESSVQTLENGVADYPRLIKVLKTHYELIPQTTLAAAEASLRDEIGPFIALLLSRADAQIERQGRRIETLKARAELQQGRLARPDEAERASSSRSRKLIGEEKLRARIVRQRKEALRYGVERLELEVLQKARELRKRLDG
ncbi:orotidine-5'-phosphate decarboxylase (EC 4.1.1.23) - fungus (Acremonium lolii) [Epichloe bromicola]|uniref:DASH complex subunit SPC19 n=1 Tax=Epichloe bromicola TaxID=79588 RepID=A0ABQ0CR40_9HYPO